MNSKTALLALTALALVSACNRGASNNSATANNSTSANAAAAAPAAPAAPAAGQAVDAAFLTANPWAPEGRCAEALTFNADGTAQSAGHSGGWSLSGDTLTMTKAGEPDQRMRVARSGNNLVMSPDGGSVTAMPCPAGSGAAGSSQNAAGEAEEESE